GPFHDFGSRKHRKDKRSYDADDVPPRRWKGRWIRRISQLWQNCRSNSRWSVQIPYSNNRTAAVHRTPCHPGWAQILLSMQGTAEARKWRGPEAFFARKPPGYGPT